MLFVTCLCCIIFSLYGKAETVTSTAKPTNTAIALRIAVAANFKSTLTALTQDFNEINNQNINIKLSSGSTGSLFTQIINGAPYDIFFSADTERPLLLKNYGLAVEDSFFHYATGTLMLTIKTKNPVLHAKQCPEILDHFVNDSLSQHKSIVIANPRTAPYGSAAIQYLKSSLMQNSKNEPSDKKTLTMQELKIIRGKNILHAQQLFTSTSAKIALLSKSQLIGSTLLTQALQFKICEIPFVNDTLKQAAIVIKQKGRTTHQERAIKKFVTYLQNPRANNILRNNGYTPP